jgi:hypothetical protein
MTANTEGEPGRVFFLYIIALDIALLSESETQTLYYIILLFDIFQTTN